MEVQAQLEPSCVLVARHSPGNPRRRPIQEHLPTSEAERKLMGGASDFVRETVTEKATSVKKMADAVLHEAKAQGLTPQAAGEAVRTIAGKVGAVAQGGTSTNPSTKNIARGSKQS